MPNTMRLAEILPLDSAPGNVKEVGIRSDHQKFGRAISDSHLQTPSAYGQDTLEVSPRWGTSLNPFLEGHFSSIS